MMPTKKILSVLAAALALPLVALGQAVLPDVTGTWRVDTPDGPQEVVVRPDSSASFGDDTVRWRLEPDSFHIAIGDEWMVYGFVLGRNKLTLSGGDLEEPVVLKRVGPPNPRPEGVEIPPAPPADRRAIPL